MLTLEMMNTLWPKGDPQLKQAIVTDAPAVFSKYGLNTPLVIAHAMAQFSHECCAGTELQEDINYAPERACEVWPKLFSCAEDCYSKVGSFAGDPDFHSKLINYVYGDRYGNRPGTNDGVTFIGRGLSQLTFRGNYETLSKTVGLDLVNNPDLVKNPEHALECAVADFIQCGCLPCAEADNVDAVTTHLNGGNEGGDERKAWLARWKSAVGVPASTMQAKAQA